MVFIEVYSTENCPKCSEIKRFLKTKSVEFVDYNVPDDVSVEEFMEQTGQLSVPVVYIDGKCFFGLDYKGIEKELKILK